MRSDSLAVWTRSMLVVIAGLTPLPVQADTRFDPDTCSLIVDGRSIKLQGDYQVVESFPDFTVKVVSSFPALLVQEVSSFPDSCGKWKRVESFPDFRIRFVESFPDLEITMVQSFPGVP